MKRDAFWTTATELLHYRKQLMLAGLGVTVSAACFGAGLMMLIPIFTLFFDAEAIAAGVHPLHQMIEQRIATEDGFAAGLRNTLANWLSANTPTDEFYSFVLIAIIIAVFTIIGSAGRYLHQIEIITITQHQAVRWRDRLFTRLIYAPVDHFLGAAASDHASRIIVDTNVLARGHQAILGKAVAEALKAFAAVCVAFVTDWKITMLALVAAPIIAVLMRKFGKVIRRASKRMLSEQASMLKMLNETLSGLSVVKAHDAEGYERRNFRGLNKRIFAQQMKMRSVRAMSSPIVETVSLIGVLVAGTIATYLVFRMDVPPTNFAVVLSSLAVAAMSLKPLTTLHVEIKEADAAAARILEAHDVPTEAIEFEERSKLPTLPRHHDSIRIESVCYRYPRGERDALQHVSLDIPFDGDFAIVGPNGSGKSTLLNLVPRFFDPSEGRVLIDGRDIREVNLRSLREQIGIVTQQTVLFEGTIAQNIAYGREWTNRQLIEAAAEAAFADEFIDTLPDGYDTMLGEGGSGLSGGQRQRLCIARTVLRNPAIMIFDEATSQIDADSEAKIVQALKLLREGRTTLTIAHRLSTVIDADCIVVMDQGQIIDQGSHETLLARCDVYRLLTQTQLQPAG